jgi:glycosyltransferase involved in cell wall biosynthesis
MRAAIYNPYLDTLGGGERYTLSFAGVLAKNGYSVDVEWKDPEIKDTLENRFGMDLKNINIIPDVKKGDGYDLCFWVSDGSIPLMHARRNILHFQVPFHGVGGKSLMNRMKLFRINKIICNSNFTKNVIDKEFGINSIVIYPPVDTGSFKPKRKENLILYVGRFSQILQNKGQDVLIEAFKKMCDEGLNDWKFILAGGVEVGVSDGLAELKELSKGYPIEIIESPPFNALRDLYGKAKIYWSASGVDQNENTNPEKVEHFGITVVEAMAAGAVPIVFNGGGHKEIVEESVSGFLWNSAEELISKTIKLISISNNKQFHMFETNAIKKSEDYSLANFENNIVSYILRK